MFIVLSISLTIIFSISLTANLLIILQMIFLYFLIIKKKLSY